MAATSGTGPKGWDFGKALQRAQTRIGASRRRRVKGTRSRDPVAQGRARIEASVPALVDLVQALTFGTDVEELDTHRAGVKIMAELAVRQLAAVGLKTGEQVDVDMSDRMKDFLAHFFSSAGRRLPPEPSADR